MSLFCITSIFFYCYLDRFTGVTYRHYAAHITWGGIVGNVFIFILYLIGFFFFPFSSSKLCQALFVYPTLPFSTHTVYLMPPILPPFHQPWQTHVYTSCGHSSIEGPNQVVEELLKL
jgi:hypothetical protein